MSSQAERIRAFKHAQHARLQKQDDEEWISSEELCTEGSSDEESHTYTKRKPKRAQPSEKRGISPLAQPPKSLETESTSSYQQQRSSNYLTPEPHVFAYEEPETTDIICSKLGDLDLKSKSETAKSRKIKVESSESSSSSVEDINDEILWRPKRGSIKLPEFPEGMQVELASLRNKNQ